MVTARTPAEILAVADSVLTDLTAYAESAARAYDPRLAERRAAANWAAGEMALAVRLLDSTARSPQPAGPADDVANLKLVIAAALARDVDDGRAARHGDDALARMWTSGSPVLPAYLHALAETAATPRALPSGTRFAAAVVEAARAAFGKLPVIPVAAAAPTAVSIERHTKRANTTTLSR